jgi:hypothetical protein
VSDGAAQSGPSLVTGAGRKALAGFFLSGLLFAFPGAIMAAWQHHVSQDSGFGGGWPACSESGGEPAC